MQKRRKNIETANTRNKLLSDSKYDKSGRSGPNSYRDKAEPSKGANNFLRSLVLESKTKLEGEKHAFSRGQLLSVDHEEALKALSKIAPSIEKKGNSLEEVLNNALIDFYEIKKKEWKEDNLEIGIRESYNLSKSKRKKVSHYDTEIYFYVTYKIPEEEYSFALENLATIKKVYAKFMPYIYTVINHLIEANYIERPDFKYGEEGNIIDFFNDQKQDFDEEEVIEKMEYFEKVKENYKKLRIQISEKSLSNIRYKTWAKRRKIPEVIKSLLEVGEKVLKNNQNINRFCYRPEVDQYYPLGPHVTHRFYYSMSDKDYIWNSISEMHDAEYGENGTIGFCRDIANDYKGKPSGPNDIPFLLHDFLNNLWNVYNEANRGKHDKRT